jgi:conjugative transposon TraK protein
MFPKTRNIETSFRYMRWISFAAILGSFISGVVFFVMAARLMAAAQSKVYILSGGKAFEAYADDGAANLPVLARRQVVSFHLDFFSLEPDERHNEIGLRRALYLADGSAKRVYDDLKENGYFSAVVSGNISQWIVVDSVRLQMADDQYHFRCYATETITRPTSRVTRDLVTEGNLRRVHRSDNNPYGFLIERWTILENKDIKIEQR